MKKYLGCILICCIAGVSNAQNVSEVKEINPSGNANPYSMTVCNNKLFFIASNDNTGYTKLFVTGGTDASTINLGPASAVIGSIQNLVSYKNKLYFSCNDGVNGQELWVNAGTLMEVPSQI